MEAFFFVLATLANENEIFKFFGDEGVPRVVGGRRYLLIFSFRA